MARPEKFRSIESPPLHTKFKPASVPLNLLDQVIMSLGEYEAIRLTDFLGFDHSEAAKRMEISRPTFSRLIDKARRKLAALLIEGKALVIEGGNIHFCENLIQCRDCGAITKLHIEKKAEYCEICGSANISDLAGRFGHGKCCRNRGRRGCKDSW